MGAPASPLGQAQGQKQRDGFGSILTGAFVMEVPFDSTFVAFGLWDKACIRVEGPGRGGLPVGLEVLGVSQQGVCHVDHSFVSHEHDLAVDRASPFEVAFEF